MEDFDIAEFVEDPSTHLLENRRLRKDDWIKLASTYDGVYKRSMTKQEL